MQNCLINLLMGRFSEKKHVELAFAMQRLSDPLWGHASIYAMVYGGSIMSPYLCSSTIYSSRVFDALAFLYYIYHSLFIPLALPTHFPPLASASSFIYTYYNYKQQSLNNKIKLLERDVQKKGGVGHYTLDHDMTSGQTIKQMFFAPGLLFPCGPFCFLIHFSK